MNLTIIKDKGTKQISLLEVPEMEIPACSTIIYGTGEKNRMGMTLCDSFAVQDPEEIMKTFSAVQPLEKVKGIIEVTWIED